MSDAHYSLGSIRLNPSFLGKFLALCLFKPKVFFEQIDTSGGLRPSLVAIGITSAIVATVNVLTYGHMTMGFQYYLIGIIQSPGAFLYSVAVGLVFTFLKWAVVGPGLLLALKGFLRTRPAKFSDFAAFIAIQSVFFASIAVIQGLLLPLWLPMVTYQLFSPACFIWSLYGFYIVFRPSLGRYLGLIGIGILLLAALIGRRFL
jgi:hypothetical protein